MKAWKEAQFGTHVLSEPELWLLCVCGATGANRNDLSQRVSTAFKSLSEKVLQRITACKYRIEIYFMVSDA